MWRSGYLLCGRRGNGKKQRVSRGLALMDIASYAATPRTAITTAIHTPPQPTHISSHLEGALELRKDVAVASAGAKLHAQHMAGALGLRARTAASLQRRHGCKYNARQQQEQRWPQTDHTTWFFFGKLATRNNNKTGLCQTAHTRPEKVCEINLFTVRMHDTVSHA